MTVESAPIALAEEYRRAFPESAALAARAARVFPGGATHVARNLDPFPAILDRASGSRKWSIEGRELIDYWVGHGALLLGHSHPRVVAAVRDQVARATHPGGSHRLEIEWAEQICALVPSAEKVRFVASGTEAVMMAVRLARIHTGRRKLLKFLGHFHGWGDGLIRDAHPPYGEREAGIPPEIDETVVTVPPGDLAAVEAALATDPDIAAVILEPTGGHWGQVPLTAEFVRALPEVVHRHGALLIFDEVITGFRVSPGGAQAHFGVRPDLTVLAKVVAGGLPGGAVVGPTEVMEPLAARSDGPRLRHPGTFNANPVSAAAGIAALAEVATGEPQRIADARAAALRRELNALLRRERLPWACYGEFSMFHIAIEGGPPPAGADDFLPLDGDWRALSRPKPQRLVEASRLAMLLEGVDWFGLRGMTSAAHTEEDVERTLAAFDGMIRRLRREGLI